MENIINYICFFELEKKYINNDAEDLSGNVL